MSQILVDSSVWVDFFNHQEDKLWDTLSMLLREKQICTLPSIIVEVVSGAHDEREYWTLWHDMNVLPKVEEPQGIWEMITHTRFTLLRKGITMGIIDLHIAATANLQKKILFTRDKHFKQIAKVIPLEFLE